MIIKVGTGYDIHRLIKGRKLILGGVEVPYEKGLEGHSDADVLLHAICDALLGAIGKGDIGEHFSNTDEKYRNVSSLILLKTVYDLVKKEGYSIINIDAIIHAEEPKLMAHKVKMCSVIAKSLAIKEDAVNIKATTHEGLGAIGNKEGIAAMATVLIKKG